MKERWVDIGKLIAILAVMVDHLHLILYGSIEIKFVTCFSVSLFILLMGVTTYWSFSQETDWIGKKVVRRTLNIMIPYAVSVFVYYVIRFKRFSWIEYKDYFLHFNISGPHYYILLYLQLLIVAPVVFYLVLQAKNHKHPHIFEILWGGGIWCVSFLTNSYTNIADIYGGGGILLGGSFLLCLYFGMLVGKYAGRMPEMKLKYYLILTVLSSLCVLFMAYLIATKGPFLDGWKLLGNVDDNPPGVSVILYTFVVMICIRLWDKTISFLSLNIINDFMAVFAWMGRQTLYIFLYHKLFLDYLLNRHFSEYSRIIKIPLYFSTMLFGSIGIGYLHRYLRKLVVSSYTYVKEK